LNPLLVDLEMTFISKMVTAAFAETLKEFQQTNSLGHKAEHILYVPAAET
jgi:hypothetical protein